ncbi:MAG: ATP-binding protein [Bacteroidetes bacterium]|nr:MAG: ATP-binding protein [Bacteroidota bacterium]
MELSIQTLHFRSGTNLTEAVRNFSNYKHGGYLIMNKDVLKKIIIESQQRVFKLKFKYRKLNIDNNANYVFTGIRRAGKTYMLYQIIKDLLVNKKNINQILYINFEDERLIGFYHSDFDLLLECYSELFGNKQPYCFFDEIQNIPAWEKFVRRLADTGYRCYITGSNAEIFSSQIATTLGGRFMIREVQPLSFKEFLDFNNVTLEKNYEYSEQKLKIKKLFDEYFRYGGFPEILKYKQKKEYLSTLYQKVFYSDIIARYNLQNNNLLKLLIKKTAESVNSETSYNRIKNIIKSTGIKAGTATVAEYYGYMYEAFLIFGISNYTAKFSDRETKKKYYFADNGVLNLFLIDQDTKLLENIVFIELKRRYGEDIFFFKRKYETDFFISEKKILIQVSNSISDYETRKREINSLISAMDELGINKAKILSYDEKEIIKIGINEISVEPVWRWLLKK